MQDLNDREIIVYAIIVVITFIIALSVNIDLDVVNQDKREQCEKHLPRSQKCVWVSVPEKLEGLNNGKE